MCVGQGTQHKLGGSGSHWNRTPSFQTKNPGGHLDLYTSLRLEQHQPGLWCHHTSALASLHLLGTPILYIRPLLYTVIFFVDTTCVLIFLIGASSIVSVTHTSFIRSTYSLGSLTLLMKVHETEMSSPIYLCVYLLCTAQRNLSIVIAYTF